ncbi:hypothetical protein VPH35_119653 [Triticum aestivum]
MPNGEITEYLSADGVDGKSLTLNSIMESRIVGRAQEKQHIIELISHQATEKFQVISIWGMGGLGKTTLVEDIYQSKELSDKFEERACATILRPFSLVELLRSLAMQLYTETSEIKPVVGLPASTKEKLPSMTVPELINELAILVRKKRCLIVLDDVSSTAEWDQLIQLDSFLMMENTSRIIVTTREKIIALHCSEKKQENIYKLNDLPYKYARELFTKKRAHNKAQTPTRICLANSGSIPLSHVPNNVLTEFGGVILKAIWTVRHKTLASGQSRKRCLIVSSRSQKLHLVGHVPK